MGVTAAIVTAAAVVGGTAYQMKNASDARSDAKDAADEQAKKQQDAENQYKQQQSDSQAAAAETEAQQKARQKQMSNSSQGYQGTILTGPLGVPNSAPQTGGKTLLGM